MLAVKSYQDRRIIDRVIASRNAHVKILGQSRKPCIVRDISATGALIEFDCVIALPTAFRLDIDADLFEALCELRHRAGRRFGVAFTSNLQGALARYG